MRLFTSKYLVRLVLSCVVLSSIPVILLGTLSYSKARDVIQTKVNVGNMQLLLQTELQVEQLLQAVESAMNQYITTPLVSSSMNARLMADDFMQVRDLSEGLYKMQSYDLGIEDVYLVNLEKQWIISNQGYSKFEASEQLPSIYNRADPSALSSWLTDLPTSSVLLKKNLPLNTNSPTGAIIAKLPVERLAKLLPQGTSSGTTLILDGKHRILTDLNDRYSSEAESDILAELRGQADKVGSFTAKAGGEEIGFTYRRSDYTDWTYVSLVSIAEITRESRAIGWYTAAITAGILALSLLLAVFVSNKMYTPIRRVFHNALGDALRTEPHRQRDEIQLIGEHIQTLKSSQTELMATVQGQTHQLKEFFVQKLLLGEIRSQEIEDKCRQFEYEVQMAWNCVLTTQIDTLEGTRYMEQDYDLLTFAISNIVIELIPERLRLEPVVVSGKQVTVYRLSAGSPEEFKKQVYAVAENIQSTVAEYLDLKISIGISRAYPDIKLTSQAYRESLESLKYRIRFGEQVILFIEDALPDHRMASSFPDWIEKQLIDAIKVPDLELARSLLKEFLTITLRDHFHPQEYQMVLLRLLTDLLREVQQSGESVEALFHENKLLIEQLFELKYIGEIEAWFMQSIIEPMASLLSTRWDNRNKKISERMMDMIHQEYETDVSLDICAERLHYHPNYLKTVFRKETGVNFSDYLAQVRLNTAKQWLVDTEMLVADIAERLRYQNSQNFIRSFRKMEGMTPGQYRKKHRA